MKTEGGHGTAVVTVIYGEYEYIATAADGRGSVEVSLDEPPPSFVHARQGDAVKVFDIGGDYMATISGWEYYGTMAINEIRRRYENNIDRLSMQEIVEQVKDYCVAQWKADSADESGDEYLGEGEDEDFPTVVVVYGLNGEYLLTTNPRKVGTFDRFSEDGEKIKVVFHGHGAGPARAHVNMICDRIGSSSIKTLRCLFEALAAGGIHDPSVGGFFLGGILTKLEGGCPSVEIYHGERPHFAAIMSSRFGSLNFLLPDSLVLATSGTYPDNPVKEALFEKKLKTRFQLDSIAFLGVGVGSKAWRILNFSSSEARSYAESVLPTLKVEFHHPTQTLFETLATQFADPRHCI